MNCIAFTSLAAAGLLVVSPASAVTNENGDTLITQAAVNAGNITPGDAPGFPVTISQPGTYRLATNLTVTTAVNGIEVRANEVTIEMGGRTLAGSGVGRNGIASFNRTLRVVNGNVRGFTLDGIRTIAPYLTVSDMIVTANGRNGIHADNGSSTAPIDVEFSSTSDSKVTFNGTQGILCGHNCRVQYSLISHNGGFGVYFDGMGGFALGNTVTQNGTTGIVFDSGGGAGNNTVSGNGFAQITGGTAMFPNACIPACPPPP